MIVVAPDVKARAWLAVVIDGENVVRAVTDARCPGPPNLARLVDEVADSLRQEYGEVEVVAKVAFANYLDVVSDLVAHVQAGAAGWPPELERRLEVWEEFRQLRDEANITGVDVTLVGGRKNQTDHRMLVYVTQLLERLRLLAIGPGRTLRQRPVLALLLVSGDGHFSVVARQVKDLKSQFGDVRVIVASYQCALNGRLSELAHRVIYLDEFAAGASRRVTVPQPASARTGSPRGAATPGGGPAAGPREPVAQTREASAVASRAPEARFPDAAAPASPPGGAAPGGAAEPEPAAAAEVPSDDLDDAAVEAKMAAWTGLSVEELARALARFVAVGESRGNAMQVDRTAHFWRPRGLEHLPPKVAEAWRRRYIVAQCRRGVLRTWNEVRGDGIVQRIAVRRDHPLLAGVELPTPPGPAVGDGTA